MLFKILFIKNYNIDKILGGGFIYFKAIVFWTLFVIFLIIVYFIVLLYQKFLSF